MKKKVLFITIILAIVLGILAGIFFNNSSDDLIVRTYASRIGDSSVPENAVEYSDYVFIAKINKILRTDYRNPVEVGFGIVQKDPYTIYEISVIENLKGNLITDEPIELVEYGGINEDGKTYTLFEDADLLNIGEYYLLLVSVIPDTDELEVSDNNRMLSLGENLSEIDSSLINQYKEIISNETNVTELDISKYDVNYNN